MVKSTANIKMGLDEFIEIMKNPDNRFDWDQNYENGYTEKILSENTRIDYLKTKKVAMVSSRDMYLVLMNKKIPAESSPTGKQIFIIAGKSCTLPGYPETKGAVRAVAYISGYYIEELGPNEIRCTFCVESDFKISVFIAK